jgi:pyruvate dehydrogenase E2 component (dihydrolipoamide acetyltransferase)
VVASPYARKLAREAGIDLSAAKGSGPGNRIVAADVKALQSSSSGKPAPVCPATPPPCALFR